MKKYLSIDHGRLSGFALMNENNEVLDVDTFELQARERNDMLVEFYMMVVNLVKKYKPDVVCCEYPSDMLNAETARQLIGYFTIVKLIAKIYSLEIEECNVLSVRKVVTGSGKAEKVNVCDSLVKKLNIKRELIEDIIYYKKKGMEHKIKKYLYDKSDALALCYYAINKDKKPKHFRGKGGI